QAAWRSILILVAGLLMAGVAYASPAVGDKVSLPAVTLLSGQKLSKGHYDGKPVIIEYWASWCPHCARQNPYLQKLYDQAKETNLEILAVSVDEDKAVARGHTKENGYTVPVAMQSPELVDTFGEQRLIPQLFV